MPNSGFMLAQISLPPLFIGQCDCVTLEIESVNELNKPFDY